MGLGPTKLGAFTALIPCGPMFLSTWETYYTHTLYLGYINGPTEGLIVACLIMAISGMFGPQIWEHQLSDVFGMVGVLGDMTFRDVWGPMLAIAFIGGHLPACVYNVVQARRKAKLPILPVFYDWVPIMVFTTSVFAWLYSPYSTILSHNHLLLMCLTLSFVIGRMTTKIILCHLTRRPFPHWTVLLVPLVGGAFVGNLPYLGFRPVNPTVELWYLRGYFVFAAVAYFSWAIKTISTICAFLDINCLTIKYPKKPGNTANGVSIPDGKRSS
ncbi:putative sn-diacylglycerol cholinephosphotransferase [Phaeomoniella chlamydospora]|uniref:Putative sn-diacylglycerol cholinephosphotransferase n=1 Tax=Phaeomoniella chlamydospora TaxID=158046 RepID=A0A0G2GY34_PHACM|nr:putative sn-diacylglycerol cholinephosphotransferase [Phaeomoniella chlamydospora]